MLHLALTVPAVAAVTAVAGCGGSSSSVASGGSSKRVPLVVYSAQGYDSAMVKAFQKATGIPTQLTDDSTGPLLARVQAERANPQWGVLWVDGDEAFAALDKQGMLVKPFQPQVSYTAAGKAVVPADKSYVPTGLTVAAAVVYDETRTPEPPASWQELLSPAWKGAVGMNDPSVSGPTYPFVAGRFAGLGGTSQGEDFFSALKGNGLHVFKTNADSLHALQTGQIKVALIQSSAGIAAGLKAPHIKTTYLPNVTPLPSVIGINAKAPEHVREAAERFAAFVLSAQGQQVMLTGDASGDSLYWPIVSGVRPNPGLGSLDSVPLQAIDPYIWGPQESAINSWFTNTIVH
jgi:iron(III) transport system substrate-binding protein